jgi:hypothetical protein
MRHELLRQVVAVSLPGLASIPSSSLPSATLLPLAPPTFSCLLSLCLAPLSVAPQLSFLSSFLTPLPWPLPRSLPGSRRPLLLPARGLFASPASCALCTQFALWLGGGHPLSFPLAACCE